MNPEEESCFRNLMTCAYAMVYSLPPGDEELLALRAALDACTQATARAAAQTEAPEKPGEQPAPEKPCDPIADVLADALRKRIEMLGTMHLNETVPIHQPATTGQRLEALTVALCPLFVELGRRLQVVESSTSPAARLDPLITLTKRVTGLESNASASVVLAPAVAELATRYTALEVRLTALDGDVGLFAARIHGRVAALEKRAAPVPLDERPHDTWRADLAKRVTALEGEDIDELREKYNILVERTGVLERVVADVDRRFEAVGERMSVLDERSCVRLDKLEELTAHLRPGTTVYTRGDGKRAVTGPGSEFVPPPEGTKPVGLLDAMGVTPVGVLSGAPKWPSAPAPPPNDLELGGAQRNPVDDQQVFGADDEDTPK